MFTLLSTWWQLWIRSRKRSDPINFASTSDSAFSQLLHHAVTHISAQSIVNCTGNTTYNYGRDVFNSNYVNNNVLMQEKVRVI